MTQVAIVTGGSRGIGAATACALGTLGYAVCVGYRADAGAAQGVVADIEDGGGSALAVQVDVTRETQILELFTRCDEALGPVTALVNNAGIVADASTVADLSAQRMQQMLMTNVFGVMLCAREAVRRMSTARGGSGGSIVNLSSAAARLGSPGEYVDYAASKGAVDTFTLGLAKEVAAQGVRVNAVRPGIIDTDIHASGGQPDRAQRLAPMIPMQRAGSADEVAQSVVWLLSDAASYVTGALIDVAGAR